MIVATVLVFGIGGMVVGGNDFSLQGISLCGLVAIVLNLILPVSSPEADDLHEEQDLVDDIFEAQ